jgi:hypothetical protein
MPMCQTIRLWFLSLTQPIYLNKQIAWLYIYTYMYNYT